MAEGEGGNASVRANESIPKLGRSNYYYWSKCAKAEMIERNCWTAVEPGFDDVQNLTRDQKMANRRAIAFLFKYTSDYYIEDIGDCELAKQAWDILQKIHASFTLIQCLEKLKEMMNTVKTDDMPMEEYMSKIQGLNRIVKGGGYGLELSDRQLAGVFLLGLPKNKYKVIISMLGKEPAERFNTQTVKAALLCGEDIEEIENPSGAFTSQTRGGKGGNNRARGGRGGGGGSSRGGSHPSVEGRDQNSNVKNSSNFNSNQERCFNCNDSNHRKRNCPNIKCFKCNSLGHMSSDCNAEVQQQNSGNKPKSRACVSSSKAMLSSGGKNGLCEFLVDSAATDHICRDKAMFSELRASSGEITMGKGSVAILGEGKLNLKISDECAGWNLLVSKVLYAPDYNFNLISTSQLAKKGIYCTSERDRLVARDADDNMEVVFTAPEREGLYVLKVEQSNNVKVGCVSGTNVNTINVTNVVALRSAVEWHSRLGHLHEEAIKKIPVIECHGKLEEKCDVCAKGKATRIGFPEKSERKSEQPLDIIHTDVMGKLVNSVGGSKYAVTFIDDYSRHVSVYYLSKKSQVFDVFKKYKTRVELLHNLKIKVLQSDGGGEYIDKEFQNFLREHGIVHRKTVKNSPEQNGIAERQNRTLANAVRCMLIQSGLPVSFWAEAMSVACEVRNLSPSRAINNQIPAVLWNGSEVRAETYERLLPFGCKGWLYQEGGKFDQRAINCVFVGYGDNTMEGSQVKGYKLWVPSKKKFVVAHDVKFDVNEFPYKIKNEKSEWTEPDVPKVADNDGDLMVWELDEEFPGEEEEDIVVNLDITGEVFHGEENVILQDFGELNNEEKHNVDFEVVMPRRSERIRKQKMCNLDCCKNNNDKHVVNSVCIVKPVVCTCCCSSMFIEECDCIEAMLMEPNNVSQALSGEYQNEWRSAMDEELSTLKSKHVFEVVDKPDCTKVLSCKWVFKVKQHQDGSIDRFRARLLARGFDQIKGVNYHRTDSPVIKRKTVRLLLAIAVQKEWVVHHLDVLSAYLNSPLEEEVYVNIPDGVECDNGKVWKLNKSLYGLKQSAREWHKKIDSILRELGFSNLRKDRCLYVNEKKSVFIGLYVDDLGLWGDLQVILCIKQQLGAVIEVRDLGPMENFLSMQVIQKDGCISINQKKYVNEIVKEFGLEHAKGKLTPLPTFEENKSTSELPYDVKMYQHAVGKLNYLPNCTRPDLSFALSRISQHLNDPKVRHWNEVAHVLRYVKETKDLNLVYSKSSVPLCKIFCDSDFNNTKGERKSVSGYVILVSNGPVCWSSKKQSLTAASVMDAEFIAMSEAVREVMWLSMILKEMGLEEVMPEPVKILCDNQGAISLGATGLDSDRSKHIDIKYCFVQDYVNAGKVAFQYVPSNENLADIFTKGLKDKKTAEFVTLMGLK